jgi:hypothetical protein
MQEQTRPLAADHITASDRIVEIGEILALGLIRLQARKSSELSRACGESWLDCAANQSGHAPENSLEQGG